MQRLRPNTHREARASPAKDGSTETDSAFVSSAHETSRESDSVLLESGREIGKGGQIGGVASAAQGRELANAYPVRAEPPRGSALESPSDT
ncbi:unnamed protein product [Pieris brassicae]|uniref:Uncharacterized protein n=1 Tax=Pieris brassicae TaxID=7116 RepID=A0A9P0TRM7_PIEBR|nr:unnamed protein product [Pieris brassicae]